MMSSGNTQYAALPYRKRPGGLDVLLITSRGSGRWIIPKGWPIAGLSPSQTAAQEALEEAGVTGRIGSERIGIYHYDKRLADDTDRDCNVEVFALEVVDQLDSWPEQHQRRREWLGIEEASERVAETELRELIRSFGARLMPAKPRR
jgi:8-oxo-dGTP pyrophosphatase MutT (NUDIX family)